MWRHTLLFTVPKDCRVKLRRGQKLDFALEPPGRSLEEAVSKAIMTKKSVSRTFLSEETTFFALVDHNFGSPVPAAIRQIYDWSLTHVGLSWGSGTNLAFHMRHSSTGSSILHIAADGWGWLCVKELRKHPPFNENTVVQELFNRFNSIAGIELDNAGIPKFDLRKVSEPQTIQQILDVVVWTIEELDRAAPI